MPPSPLSLTNASLCRHEIAQWHAPGDLNGCVGRELCTLRQEGFPLTGENAIFETTQPTRRSSHPVLQGQEVLSRPLSLMHSRASSLARGRGVCHFVGASDG